MTDKALETLLMAAVFVPTITFAMIAMHFSEKRKRKRDAVDAADMRERGGYIPTCDHGVPEEVPYENYLHYRKRCVELGG
jgi:hypothetical protein